MLIFKTDIQFSVMRTNNTINEATEKICDETNDLLIIDQS